MLLLNVTADLRQFAEQLASAPQRVLMLDYDGTLAPFRTDRERAVVYPGVRELLVRLQADRRTRLIIVSGRSVDTVLPLLGMEPPPEVWGSHGMERLGADGRYDAAVVPDTVKEGTMAATRWAQAQDLLTMVEQKPFGLAFHWRGLTSPAREIAAKLIRQTWEIESGRYEMVLTPFDGGLELRARDMNKGRAVRYVLEGSHPDAVAAYLGDDMTDEDGFAAVKGRGLAALVRPELRDTTADIWLHPPEELLEFLQFWLEPRAFLPAWLREDSRSMPGEKKG